MASLIESRGAAVLMPDLQHCGGPTGFLQAAAQAHLSGLPVSNHLFIETNVHLLAACTNAYLVEYMAPLTHPWVVSWAADVQHAVPA